MVIKCHGISTCISAITALQGIPVDARFEVGVVRVRRS